MRSTLVLTTAAALAIGVLGAAPAGAGTGSHHARVASAPAARAGTATTLGQTGGTIAACSGTAPAATLLAVEAAGQPTYVAPSAGVLTSFTHIANSRSGQVRVIVFGPSATANHKTVFAKSPKFTVNTSASNTFSIRVPMRAGDTLGLGTTATLMGCVRAGTVAGDTSWLAPFDPDLSADFASTTSLANYRPNITAVLEPDVDGDQYGDITQDACPASAYSQAVCPEPDTTITKKPKRNHKRTKVKVKFTSSIPGSTFQCSIDGRKFKTCKSPYKKHFKRGHHSLRVRAVSPVGVPDPKPAKVKLNIGR